MGVGVYGVSKSDVFRLTKIRVYFWIIFVHRDDINTVTKAIDGDEKGEVPFLIQQGARIEVRCNEMRTPLSYAAQDCAMAHLTQLTENDAAINCSDWQGNTPCFMQHKRT